MLPYTRAYCTSGNAPAGYIGVLPQGYSSSGALLSQGTWLYNSSSVVGIGSAATFTGTKGTSVYSYGMSQAYNGSGYSSYTTYASPNQVVGQ